MKKAAMVLLSAALASSALISCSDDEITRPSDPQTYVLVHGAWQAPYVWNKVKADLSSQGYHVVVVELPGHGTDQTPTHTLSLDVYANEVVEAISQVQGKVILVGHSMGGMVVTQVAEKIPSRIEKLVYIGAFVPKSGQSLGEIATTDPDSKLGQSLVESADHLTLDVKREDLVKLFIPDGSVDDQKKVVDNYRAEPAIPFGGKITLTADHFGAVQKVYIKTLQDIVISPGLQDRMIAVAGISDIYTVDASHSPFLSQSKAISDILIRIMNGKTVARVD